jgi:hypothetical protein
VSLAKNHRHHALPNHSTPFAQTDLPDDVGRLGDGDEVPPQKDAYHARDLEELLGQGRAVHLLVPLPEVLRGVVVVVVGRVYV